MHRVSCVFALVFVAISTVFADTRSDLLALADNAHARVMWIRLPWCDSLYRPVQAYRSKSEANEAPFTQLVCFDTDAGKERYLDPVIGSHLYPRFTRKDGSRVVWTDENAKCAWIMGYSGTPAKTKLIDGGDYAVVHCRYDPENGKEYVYTLSNDDKRLSQVPLKADYTADIAARTTVYTGSAALSTSLGVSSDGKYFSTFLPWPNTAFVDLTTRQAYSRHVDDPFGCQPNMAPDKSYRFFYLRSDHDVLRMWGPALSTDNWDVRVDKMPGNFDFNGGGYDHDCVLPRWTNSPRFFTNSYPLVMWNYSDGRVFDSNPAQLMADQQKDSCGTGVFCLGKFSADYTTVEKYVRITTCDVRKRDVNGDGWIAAASGVQSRPRTSRESPAAWNLGHVMSGSDVTPSVSIVNCLGKVQHSPEGRAAGVRIVVVFSEGGVRLSRTFVQ